MLKTWPSQGRDSETLDPGHRKPQKCLESKVQSSYPQIKVHGKIFYTLPKVWLIVFFPVVTDGFFFGTLPIFETPFESQDTEFNEKC